MIPGPRRMAAREPQVLAVTADEGLADDVLRVAAAVGVAAVVQPTAGAAAAQWSIADLVVVDAARLGEVALLGLPKRSRVVVIQIRRCPTECGGRRWRRGSARW